jgi:SAM-dependent methyltransferase
MQYHAVLARLARRARVMFRRLATPDSEVSVIFPLSPPLPLPPGVPEAALREFVGSVQLADAPPEEMKAYCAESFHRLVYTYGLVRDLEGPALELGANPYFATILFRMFTRLELTLANYFGPQHTDPVTQIVSYPDFRMGETRSVVLTSRHFNIEQDTFPFPDGHFAVVLFCEIIEHLLSDPVAVLREIKRVLRPGGALVLTTPNVNRLENVARMVAGANIYDPYSGYGPYGRHNREYNKHDLFLLLTYLGFELDTLFTADVHRNAAAEYVSPERLVPLLRFREHDLGQYIFCRARSVRPAGSRRPSFLFRSYPPGEIE